MKIVVNNQFHLSEFRPSDKSALVEHLNDRDIYDRTFRIPFPYTEADAEAFLARVAKATEQHGHPHGNENAVGAEPARRGDGHRTVDAEFARFVGCCADDAATGDAADDDGFGT